MPTAFSIGGRIKLTKSKCRIKAVRVLISPPVRFYQGSGVLNGEYPQVAGRIPITPPLDCGVALPWRGGNGFRGEDGGGRKS